MIADPRHHSVWLRFVAVVANVLATGLKLGERSQTGALLLATALVDPLHGVFVDAPAILDGARRGCVAPVAGVRPDVQPVALG